MDVKKALLITKDRIENMKSFTPSNASEVYIAKETLDYLEFVEKILIREENDDNSKSR